MSLRNLGLWLFSKMISGPLECLQKQQLAVVFHISLCRSNFWLIWLHHVMWPEEEAWYNTWSDFAYASTAHFITHSSSGVHGGFIPSINFTTRSISMELISAAIAGYLSVLCLRRVQKSVNNNLRSFLIWFHRPIQKMVETIIHICIFNDTSRAHGVL